MGFSWLCSAAGTDKGKYAGAYDELFRGKRTEVKKLFEIGILGGSSLWLWDEWFYNLEGLVGLDLRSMARTQVPEKALCYEGLQQDRAVLQDIVKRHGPFDVVVDDGGHNFKDQVVTFEELGGHTQIYIVEDVSEADAQKWLEVPSKSLSFLKGYRSTKTAEHLLVWAKNGG